MNIEKILGQSGATIRPAKLNDSFKKNNQTLYFIHKKIILTGSFLPRKRRYIDYCSTEASLYTHYEGHVVSVTQMTEPLGTASQPFNIQMWTSFEYFNCRICLS